MDENEILEEVVEENPEIAAVINQSRLLLMTALEMINAKLTDEGIGFRYLSQRVDILEQVPSSLRIH
ncbi:MAG: hypothetical protein PHC90_14395 [Syntrophorhabdaceae bacterium]|jgi:hypothetical protein|nr:hypothetical protein [Syntrophorhabdaceae bacterium]